VDDVIIPTGDDSGEVVVARVHENGHYEPFSFDERRRVPVGADLVDVRTTTIGSAVRRAANMLKSRDGVAYIATLSDYQQALEDGPVDPESENDHHDLVLRTYLAKG
jgi:hypothetical protein